ncbi:MULTISPECIES: hypothetical protein [unclassified Nocardia]|uniref:hypothetical protein n=1 Tax=unclassified Nocardia TaxID=2637762 RepID=UPI001CE3EE2E|nr:MULTISPECIES: hypothetical protein [unclassified Nocardia]
MWDIKFDDARFDGIKAAPPSGCQVEDAGGYFALECERQAPTLLDAVAELCAEIRADHGLMMSDLGVEKVEEWCSDGLDGWGAKILGQLLLMAIERAPLLGYRIDDLIDFLRTAAGEDCAPARSAGDR